MAKKQWHVEEADAPACWASYLINGDSSGIEQEDIDAADAMVEAIGMGSPVDTSAESFFRWHPDYSTRGERGQLLGADCLTYKFMRPCRGAGEK